jgi:adenosine deaminase
MAQRKVAVEICLTSNDVILGVEGANHPLPEYLAHGVPVALATDDQGVSRSDMTQEYLRAEETYNFSYTDLKRMARQSLEHSFLAGESLWRPGGNFQVIAACAADHAGTEKTSAACQKFLDASDRARVQWELEGAFASFEKKY